MGPDFRYWYKSPDNATAKSRPDAPGNPEKIATGLTGPDPFGPLTTPSPFGATPPPNQEGGEFQSA